MRSSIFIATPFLALVSAARTSTYSYSNPLTSFLTQTNSNGVITGMPSGAAAVTSQPAVATIPAGLPEGETTLYYSASATLQSFAISIGPSTTVYEGGNVGPSASVTVGSSAGVGKPTGKGKGSGNGSGNGGSGSSSSSSASDNAAPTNVKAAAGLLAVGAAAALLL